MTFYDFTIHALGGLHSQRTQDTDRIEPAAIDVMRRMIRAGGGACPVDGLERLSLSWTAEPALPGVAMATWSSGGRPLTTSVLLSAGVALEHAQQVLSLTQRMLDSLWQVSPTIEAGPGLLLITERPALVTLVLPGPPHPDLPMVADMETCLMAAWLSED